MSARQQWEAVELAMLGQQVSSTEINLGNATSSEYFVFLKIGDDWEQVNWTGYSDIR
jgi:hypothetical protein